MEDYSKQYRLQAGGSIITRRAHSKRSMVDGRREEEEVLFCSTCRPVIVPVPERDLIGSSDVKGLARFGLPLFHRLQSTRSIIRPLETSSPASSPIEVLDSGKEIHLMHAILFDHDSAG